jgi:hypothetical protein
MGKSMKWDFQINITISKGRKKIFAIERYFSFLKRWQKQHRQFAQSCFRKTRFTSEQAALNAYWFEKHPDKAYPHRAYLCEVCDGWHLTTIRDGDKNGRE